MAKVDVLTQMQELVYERCVDMIRKAMAVGNDDADVDLADGIGLDDTSMAPAAKKPPRVSKKSWAFVPPAMHVPMPLIGSEPGWAPLVAPQLNSQLVHMQINETNLRNLYAVVSHELASKAPADAIPKHKPCRLGKEPRGEKDKREYHIRSKGWVVCTKHGEPEQKRPHRQFTRVAPKRRRPKTPIRKRRTPEPLVDDSPHSDAGVTFDMDDVCE